MSSFITLKMSFVRAIVCAMLVLTSVFSEASLQYATRTDSVRWQSEGSKFFCRLSHEIDGFGEAIFEREAGESTHFYLKSKMPRMKSGQASLVSRPPAWSSRQSINALSMVAVTESMMPITLERKLSERMLAELEKGMLLDFKRQPLYGDPQSLRVTLSSIGFRVVHQDYLICQGNLLPVNFKQIRRSTLYYNDNDDELTRAAEERLDKIIEYSKEDSSVKTFYIDGHTDSQGIRNENLMKSQRRTEKVMDYLIENGIDKNRIVARWHGERYQVASNRTEKGRVKNRRVTVRLSKEAPNVLVQSENPDADLPENQEESQ